MKKFTLIDTYESIVKKETFESIATKIVVENLSVETSNVENITSDYKIIADSAYFENLKTLVNNIFTDEKIFLLEKARNAIFSGDISWIDDEIQKIKENKI